MGRLLQGLHLVVGHLAPDVLGEDRHVECGEHGVGLLGGDDHGVVVRRLHLGDPGEVADVHAQLLPQDAVVGVRHVLGRQWLAVAPLHVVADMEGPDPAAVGDAAVLRRRHLGGEVRHRLVVGVVPREEVVADAEALPGDGVVRRERVHVVDVALQAHAVDDGRCGWGGRRRRRRQRRGRQQHGDHEQQQDDGRQAGPELTGAHESSRLWFPPEPRCRGRDLLLSVQGGRAESQDPAENGDRRGEGPPPGTSPQGGGPVPVRPPWLLARRSPGSAPDARPGWRRFRGASR